MDSRTLGTLILCGLLLIIGVAGFIDWRRHNIEYEVESSEDNPMLQAVAEYRQAILEQFLQSLSLTFRCMPDQLVTTIENTDFNTNVLIVAYKDFLCRFYCNWSHNRIKFEFSYSPFMQPDEDFTRSKIFKVHQGCVDMAAVDNFVRSCYYHYCGLHKNADDQLTESAAAAVQLANDKETSDKELIAMLIAVWDNFRISQKPKEAFTDITNATRLLAYILRFHRADFQEYVQGTDKSITGEKNDEKGAE